MLDARGKELRPVRFEAVGAIYDGRYAVRVGGKWGIVDGSGREVFPPVFEQAMPFCREVAIFCEGRHCGLVDKAGTVLLPPTYSGIEPLSASVATASMLREDGTEHADYLVSSGLVDAIGKVLVGQNYYSISTFSRHLLLAWDSGGRYHLLDSASGQTRPGLPELAGRPGKLSEGLAAVDLRQPDGDAAAGYIDAQGKIVIEPVYDANCVGDCAGGIAIVSRDGRCGVIDRRDRAVLALE